MEVVDIEKKIAELEYDRDHDVNMYSSHIDKEIRDDKYDFAIDVLKDLKVSSKVNLDETLFCDPQTGEECTVFIVKREFN